MSMNDSKALLLKICLDLTIWFAIQVIHNKYFYTDLSMWFDLK